MRILYDILNEDTLIYAAGFDYQWEGIPQQANKTNFALKLKFYPTSVTSMSC